MKALCSSILFFLAVGCATQPGAPSVDLDAERSALIAADVEWSEKANIQQDFVDNFTDDAWLLPPETPALHGKEAIGNFVAVLHDMPGFALQWTATKSDVSRSGDMGYTMGNYELWLENDEGSLFATEGKYVTVWKKQASGEWRVVADIFNPNHPPAE